MKQQWIDLHQIILLQSYVRLTSVRQLIFSQFLMRLVRQVSLQSPLLHGEPLTLFTTGNIKGSLASRTYTIQRARAQGPGQALGRSFFLSAQQHILMDSKPPPSLVCQGILCQGTNTHTEDISDLFVSFLVWLLKFHSGKGKRCLKRCGGQLSSLLHFMDI